MKLFKITILLAVLSSFIFANDTKKEILNVVPVSWVKEHINDKRVVVLDIREYKDYKKGHVKGAVNVPGLQNLFDAKSWMMPKFNSLKTLFSNAGIDKDSLVVAYDNGDFFWAARLYWILEVLGHKNVAILEYSYGKYLEEHLPISIKDTSVIKKAKKP